MTLRAANNSVIGTPNYEVQRRMSRWASDGEEVATKQFGTVKVGRTVEYSNKPGENKMAWMTVQSVGPGASWMKGRYRLDRVLQRGDVVGFDASQYQNWQEDGVNLMMLPVDAALCRFNVSDALPIPLGVYFMSAPDEDATRRFVLGKRAQAAGFILTNDTLKGEIRITDNPNSKVRYSVERIIAVGGGGMSIGEGGQQALGDTRAYATITVDGGIKRIRTKEPIEIVPDPGAVGLLGVFINAMSCDCYVDGTRYRFTNWDRVKGLATTG